MLDRRQFLVGSAAVALAGRSLASRDPVIDVHHHYFTPEYLKRRSDELGARVRGYENVLSWTAGRTLAEMDANGVVSAVLSMSAPLWFGDAGETRALTRAANEFARELAQRHVGRFGYFASLPLPIIDDAMSEIAWALGEGAADGVVLLSNYDDLYLGDARFEPVLEELDRRDAVVYVHPTAATCCTGLTPDIQPAFLELPFDTSRTIGSLLYSGALSKHRRIRYIFSHGGGTIPFLADRLSQWARARPDLAARLPDGPMTELRRLSFDTASVTNAMAMAALTEFVPDTQLLFGTDYPFVPTAPQLAELRDRALSASALGNITYRNALRLMPKLHASA